MQENVSNSQNVNQYRKFCRKKFKKERRLRRSFFCFRIIVSCEREDAKPPRGKDAKSVTEINFVNSGDEHESIVGWGCGIADEWLTRGARNVIHICDSNVNGSSEREAISRRYPNNEKSIQSYPSPEFLNSLSFIKKFYPVLNLLHAPRVPQKQHGCSLLHLLAIRTRCTPSVRKFATPRWGEGQFTKVLTKTAAIHVILS